MPTLSTTQANTLHFSGRYNALIVDDEQSVRRLVERGLQRAGTLRGDEFVITQATNLEDAKTKLQDNQEAGKPPFDLMITDNSMPSSGQGLALLDFASRLGAAKPRHCFMLSSDLEVAPTAVSNGAEGFYPKPVSFDALQAIVDRSFPREATVAAPAPAGSADTTAAPVEGTAAAGGRRARTASSPAIRRALSSPDLHELGEGFAFPAGKHTAPSGGSSASHDGGTDA